MEGVLHGGDRGDRAGLGQLRGIDVAHPQVPDQALFAELCEHGEPLGDRLAAGCIPPADPQVDQVEMIKAEFAQVSLD